MRHLTFGWEAGCRNNFTLPESSPVAIRVLSAFLHTVLTSVPSACSGHTPIVWNERLQFCVAHFKSQVCDGDVICRHNDGFPKVMRKHSVFFCLVQLSFSNVKQLVHTIKQFIIARVTSQHLTILRPINMSNVAGVTLLNAN